jgi:crotonobetaine/carnitine-CoA ligase
MNTIELGSLGGGTPAGLLASRAALAPGNVALMCGNEEFTYRHLDDRATAVARGLVAFGLAPEETVGSFLSNRPETLITALGLNRAGGIIVPVNTAFTGSFLSRPLEVTGVRLLFTEATLADAVTSMDPMPTTLTTIVFVDHIPARVPSGVGVMTLTDLVERGSEDVELPLRGPADTHSIAFTSGTTGRSKGVVSPNLAPVIGARESAVAFELNPRDRAYTAFPLFHGMALVSTCLAAWYAGATAIVAPQLTISGFWDDIRRTQATQFNALGAVLHMLLSLPPSEQDRNHHVTRVFSAPSPPDALYRFESRFGVHLIEGYGQTETKNILYNPIRGRKVGSMGIPTATSIVEIHDEDGTRLPPGQPGEIVYRPTIPHIMLKGYFGDPDATLAATKDLWWHTGDLGVMDADGFFYFFDRKKDALRRRGENISSVEVEEVIVAHPEVQIAAVLGVQSELGENEVLAVVQVTDPDTFDHAGLHAFCVQHLPRFMVPRYLRAMTALPLTPTGKVRKVELREDGITTDTFDAITAGVDLTARRTN